MRRAFLALCVALLSLVFAGCKAGKTPAFANARIKIERASGLGPTSRLAIPDSPTVWWYLTDDTGELAVRYEYVGRSEHGDVYVCQTRVNGKTNAAQGVLLSGAPVTLYESGKDRITIYTDK